MRTTDASSVSYTGVANSTGLLTWLRLNYLLKNMIEKQLRFVTFD